MKNSNRDLIKATKYLANFLGITQLRDCSKGKDHKSFVGLDGQGKIFNCDFYKDLGKTQIVWDKLGINEVKLEKISYDQAGWFLDINNQKIKRTELHYHFGYDLCEAALIDTYLFVKKLKEKNSTKIEHLR